MNSKDVIDRKDDYAIFFKHVYNYIINTVLAVVLSKSLRCSLIAGVKPSAANRSQVRSGTTPAKRHHLQSSIKRATFVQESVGDALSNSPYRSPWFLNRIASLSIMDMISGKQMRHG